MKKALMLASVASMIDLFNMDNIKILRELGYEVHVACNFSEGSITSVERVEEFKRELDEQNILYFDIPIPRSVKRIKDIYTSRNMIRELLNENSYSIMHCHSPIGGVVARSVAKKFRRQGLCVIYTAHGFHFFKGAGIAKWLAFYPIEKIYSKVTDKLITINHEDYYLAQKRMKAKHTYYVPGIGVDVDEINTSIPNVDHLRNDLNINVDDFVLVSVGQLSSRKNHEVVIRALGKLNKPNIKYIIIGDGELKNDLTNLISELALQDNVYLLGYRKNVKELLSICDCFIFPSKQEGLPVSLMEAMAIPLPVICSNIRGNTDLIDNQKGGYLFDSSDEIASYIVNLSLDKELNKRYSTYNLNKIQQFSIKNISIRMQKIYEE